VKSTGLIASLLAAAALILAPGTAHAHLHLTASEPAAGTTVNAAPVAIRLSFSEGVELGFSDLSLIGPLGEVRIGDLAVPVDSPEVLEVRVLGKLVAGEYTIRWQAASADGHPMRGEYTFAVAENATGLAAPTAAPPPPAPSAAPAEASHFGVESPGYVAVRWGTFVALLAVIGAVAFRLLVLGRLRKEEELVAAAAPRAAQLGLWAAALLLVAAFLRLAAQSVAILGDAAGADRIGGIVLGTLWGMGWMLQVGGALLALAGFILARRGADLGWLFAALGAVILAFFPALSGHAASTGTLQSVSIVADGLHVFGAGGWLGSLLFVLVVGLPAAARSDPRGKRGALAAMVAAFSAIAIAFVSIVVITGLIASWIHLGSFSALTASRYGKTLLVKLAVVVVVAAAGHFNWRHLGPALKGGEGSARLQRSAAFELAAALLVLAVTAALVATPLPPH
jgi:copper transport protein